MLEVKTARNLCRHFDPLEFPLSLHDPPHSIAFQMIEVNVGKVQI